jgi:hypothetical protein
MPKLLRSAFLAVLLTALMILAGCYSTHSVISQKYKYDDEISFTIDKVQEGTNISTGNGYYYASRGHKFVFLFVSLKNGSSQKKKLDFGNFYLLDPKTHGKYKVEFAMLETAINMFGSVDSQIQGNDTKKRKLVFTFPKDETPEMFSVNDVIYKINYGSNAN